MFFINNWFNLILLFLLLFIVIFFIFKKIFEKTQALIISIIISFLSVYYITSENINFLSTTYNLFGAIILISIPLIILFFFNYSSDINPTTRKILWFIFLILSFIFLRQKTIKNYFIEKIYIFVFIIIIIIIIFDNKIKNNFIKSKLK